MWAADRSGRHGAPLNPFPLLTECSVMDDGVVFRVTWDEQVVRTDQVESILDEFAEIILVLPGRLDDALHSVREEPLGG